MFLHVVGIYNAQNVSCHIKNILIGRDWKVFYDYLGA